MLTKYFLLCWNAACLHIAWIGIKRPLATVEEYGILKMLHVLILICEKCSQVKCVLHCCFHLLFPRERVISDSLSPSAQSLPGGKVLRQLSCLRVVLYSRHQFSSVTQTCPTLCNPMDCITPGFPVHHQLPELTQTHVHWVSDAIQLSYSLSSPSLPIFDLSQHQGLFQWVSSSHQVAKVWSFSFSISPSNEYSGWISFRMDWLDLLAVQGTLKSLLQYHSSKTSILRHSAFFMVQLTFIPGTGKTIALTRWTFVGKVMSVLFNLLSRLVIALLPRIKHLLISWLQSPFAVILEPKKIKSLFPLFPHLFAMKWWDWMSWFSFSGCSVLSQLFHSLLSLSPRDFSSSLSAIRVVSSAYLRLLIFFPAILILACASSSPAFHMMYSACKLNKQGDNIQPWHTPFPIWNQSIVPCTVLTVFQDPKRLCQKGFPGLQSSLK